MVPALDVFVDSMVAGHNGALSCAEPGSRARNEQEWQSARASFVATLWANGFPADFVTGADRRLAAPAVAVPCADPDALGFGTADHEGWRKAFGYAVGAMDLAVVAQPVPGEAWRQIRSLIADELPHQARLLECIAVVYPYAMPAMVHDWDAMIVKIGGRLVGAGLPRDEISAALGNAEANALWHRAPPDKVADLATSCRADQDWQNRFAAFTFLALGGHIDSLLPQPADSDGDQ